MSLAELEGKTYGPTPWHVATDSVADFVMLTGEDPGRWTEHAPPGFAAAALFSVAPDLLAELYRNSVVHGEQTFEWHRPVAVGSSLSASGVVTRVRERAGVFFVTFEVEVEDGEGSVISAKSLFLASGESQAAGDGSGEVEEPEAGDTGDLTAGQVSASRADLVRYAAATRDWNPVHWDHRAAVAAGFPGVVVHGLLQAGWALAAAGRVTDPSRFTRARFRFRNPLLPASPVSVSTFADGPKVDVTIADGENEYLTADVHFVDE